MYLVSPPPLSRYPSLRGHVHSWLSQMFPLLAMSPFYLRYLGPVISFTFSLFFIQQPLDPYPSPDAYTGQQKFWGPRDLSEVVPPTPQVFAPRLKSLLGDPCCAEDLGESSRFILGLLLWWAGLLGKWPPSFGATSFFVLGSNSLLT